MTGAIHQIPYHSVKALVGVLRMSSDATAKNVRLLIRKLFSVYKRKTKNMSYRMSLPLNHSILE